MKRYDVYGIGQAILDTEYEVSDSLLEKFQIPKGQMTRLDAYRHQALVQELERHCSPTYCSCGGSVANSMVALQALGGSAFYSGTVAADLAGRSFLNALNQCGVAYNANASIANEITGQCVVLVTPDSERSMNTFLGASSLVGKEHLDGNALDQSQWLLIEGYVSTCENTVEAVLEAKKRVQAKSGRIALTFCDPFMVEAFREALDLIIDEGVDLIFCNEHEATLWSGTLNFSQGVSELLRRTKILVVTCGENGACVFTESGCIKIPAVTVSATNTNGAGDNFAGAYLYALSQGMDLEQAGHLASLTAATVVTQGGPRLSNVQYQDISHKFDGQKSIRAI